MPPRILAIGTLVLLFTVVAAQDLKGPVEKATPPDQWQKQFDDANSGKYDEKDSVSGPMFQILQAIRDPLNEESAKGRPCTRAAVSRAWDVVSDAAYGAPLTALKDAVISAMGNILSLGEKGLAEWVTETGKDAIKQAIKDKLKGQKPEMYKTSVSKAGCDIKLMLIWDKAAGTYEVYVYGDCKCSQQAYGAGPGGPRLKTFAVHLKGKAAIEYSSTSQSIVLNVGRPKISVQANCQFCTNPSSSSTTTYPSTTTSTIPPTQPGGGGGTTPPPAGGDACSVPKPCPECVPIYDAIQAACKRLGEIPGEQRDAAGRLGGATNRLNVAKQGLEGLTGDARKRQEQDVKDAQKDVDDINKESQKLTKEEQTLRAKTKDLAEQLTKCTATKCGTGQITEPKTAGIPKVAYGLAAVPAVFIAGGGGGKTTSSSSTSSIASTTTTVPATTTVASTTSTSSTSSTTTTSPTTSVPPSVGGTYTPTGCRTSRDVGGHEGTIRMCSSLNSLSVSDNGQTITISGSAPFVTVTCNFNPLTGAFSGEGRGTVAGFPNVTIRVEGVINNNGQLAMSYTMGANGELPGGQPVTYEITAQRSSF